MSRTLFISRYLNSDSYFHSLAEKYFLEITELELLDFQAIEFESPNSEYLFFYSRKAIDFFIKIADLKGYKVAVFGASTGEYLFRKTGRKADFTGETSGRETARQFRKLYANESVCFVIGKQSLRSVHGLFPAKSNWTELCVYSQESKSHVQLKEFDMAVLTSPLNAEAFLKNGGKAVNYFAIGRSTQRALKLKSIISEIPEESSERALALLVEEYLKRK